MKRFILDTNICLKYITGHTSYPLIEQELHLNDPDTIVMISVVTKAELNALAFKRNWGRQKIETLSNLLRKLHIIDINEADELLINTYAEIDAFSQGRHPSKVSKNSARNMGKNDLWIAATTYVSGAELVTTDNDFGHLASVWFNVHAF